MSEPNPALRCPQPDSSNPTFAVSSSSSREGGTSSNWGSGSKESEASGAASTASSGAAHLMQAIPPVPAWATELPVPPAAPCSHPPTRVLPHCYSTVRRVLNAAACSRTELLASATDMASTSARSGMRSNRTPLQEIDIVSGKCLRIIALNGEHHLVDVEPGSVRPVLAIRHRVSHSAPVRIRSFR